MLVMGHTQNRISYTNAGANCPDCIAARQIYGKVGRPKRNIGLEPDMYGVIVGVQPRKPHLSDSSGPPNIRGV